MKNDLQLPIPRMLTLGESVANGYDLHGVAIGITRNTGALTRADVAAAELARDIYEVGAQAARDRNGELQVLSKEAYEYGLLSRDILKPILGKRYSAAWNQTGLVGSLKIPSNHEDLQGLMQSMRTFFTNNAAWEAATQNVTAARAEDLRSGLSSKRAEVQAAAGERKTLMNLRDQKVTALRDRLRLFILEAGEKIGPLDPRWVAFGLNMPGARATPDVPQNVRAILIGNNALSVKWDKAARAEYYRVWARVVGSQEELVIMGSPGDIDFTIEGLPSNATVEIAISAINNGGESARSTVLVVLTT
ncbi:MAG: fibronectin type III domain-containing protein [Verrucomicrobia bacterium]|nr:fibronectin type III domain-containing protein [Verrucomicrobiota bacterium]